MSEAREESAIERFERLPGVHVARRALADAFGLSLLVVGPKGPAVHARGGVMAGSSEVCRAALFSPAGFARCDALYREIGRVSPERVTDGVSPEGVTAGPGSEPASMEMGRGDERGWRCHLGLAALSVPARTDDGAVVAHVVASGFVATGLAVAPPPDVADIARGLRALDPHLPDPSAPTRKLPVVRGDREAIVRSILRAAAQEIAEHVEDEARRARGLRAMPGLFGIVGASPRMHGTFELLRRVAASDAPVLVTGESGTGKELAARAIHTHGARKSGPFVAQSCGAITEDALESLLFGHVRGAFSGAIRASEGVFGAAKGGTLFLDEVGEMSPAMQVKLLRVLSDGTYLPVGSTSPRTADVRVIAATHRDLSELVREGAFRQDLYYRLHVLRVDMPPLRERAGDVRLLIEHFLARTEGAPSRVSASAHRCLARYAWPGNVRELRAEVERWAVAASGEAEVGPEHLSPAMRDAGGYSGANAGELATAAAAGTTTLAAAIEALERAILTRGLERTEGNRTRLAKELDISRTTLNERIKKFGLE